MITDSFLQYLSNRSSVSIASTRWNYEFNTKKLTMASDFSSHKKPWNDERFNDVSIDIHGISKWNNSIAPINFLVLFAISHFA